jgi:ectoine hydroxylase-related dioxygenase (phytanoyl-CoA dioxygenase family)
MEHLIKQLREEGYCVLEQEYDKETIEKLLRLTKKTFEETKSKIAKTVPYLNLDQPTIYNLQNKDFFFLEAIFQSKGIEVILKNLLNDVWYKQIPQNEPNYVLRSFSARSSNYAMPLHLDSFIPYISDYPYSVQTATILEDQNVNNGCTIVVPRSHLLGKYAEQDAIKYAVPLETKAGDVVLFDCRLWHATTANTSGKTRWSILATFQRWWLKQQFNVTDNLPQENYERLTDNQKSIVGFCSIPHNNEEEGIDMKRGYDSLFKNVKDYKN